MLLPTALLIRDQKTGIALISSFGASGVRMNRDHFKLRNFFFYPILEYGYALRILW